MPVVRLENVFRQAEVSPIVRNAHRINHGQMPEFAEHSDFEFAGFDNEFMAADFVAQLYGKDSGRTRACSMCRCFRRCTKTPAACRT